MWLSQGLVVSTGVRKVYTFVGPTVEFWALSPLANYFCIAVFHHPLLSDLFGPVIGGPNMGHTHVSASSLEGPMHRSCGTLVFYEAGLL